MGYYYLSMADLSLFSSSLAFFQRRYHLLTQLFIFIVMAPFPKVLRSFQHGQTPLFKQLLIISLALLLWPYISYEEIIYCHYQLLEYFTLENSYLRIFVYTLYYLQSHYFYYPTFLNQVYYCNSYNDHPHIFQILAFYKLDSQVFLNRQNHFGFIFS